MRVLVTGSEGSLMQAVIPALLREGHQVIGVDNLQRYGPVSRARDYQLVVGDLCDAEFAAKAVAACDGIIQSAASIYGVTGFHRFPADILGRDLCLHENILRAAVNSAVGKVAYVSSSMVYERARRHPCSEDDVTESIAPSTSYGLSKLVGERLTAAYSEQYGLKYVIWRPFNVITPYERAGTDRGMSHVFADFIQMIVAERRRLLPVIGDGAQVRCFTWIDDVASAIARWSFAQVTDFEVFNLGNPEPVSMVELAQLIFSRAKLKGLLDPEPGGLEFAYSRGYEDDVRVRIPDVNKAGQVLGFRPTRSLLECVDACLDEFLQRREPRVTAQA